MKNVDETGKPVWLANLPESLRVQHGEIVELLNKNKLGKCRDQIETLLRVSIELVLHAADSADIQGVVSRMGGEPDLPPGQTWPTWNDAPLAFLGQVVINDEIKALDVDNLLPQDGLLSFFAQIDAPEIGQHCAILHFPNASSLVRTPAPVEKTADRRPRLVLKHTALISARGRLCLPSGNAPFVDQINLTSDEKDAYHDSVFRELMPPSPRHRLLGWPTAATYLDEQDQLFVAQFDSDDALDLEMGDVETLRMYIHGEALNESTLATAASTLDQS